LGEIGACGASHEVDFSLNGGKTMSKAAKDAIQAEVKHHAEWATQAMREYPGYKEIQGDLPDDAAHIDCAVDLVTDLLHLARMKWQADPDYILRVARMHFDTESGA
jgi:hypothetical protein